MGKELFPKMGSQNPLSSSIASVSTLTVGFSTGSGLRLGSLALVGKSSKMGELRFNLRLRVHGRWVRGSI